MALQQETLNRLKNFVNSEKFNQVSEKTQKRVTELLDSQSRPGAASSFAESGTPIFGAEQVIPKSPMSAFERFRLGTATPEGRKKILEEKYGTVLGPPGREVVPGPEGLQSVDPKGFRLSDIPGDVAEFLPEVPNIAGEVMGSVIGGGLTKTPQGAVAGRSIGGGVGTFVGEGVKSGLGKALGTRPDSSVTEEIANAAQQAAEAGFLELGFGAGGKALGGLKNVGKGAVKNVGHLGRRVIQSLSQAKKMTSDWLEERVKTVGAKEVFSPEKLSPDYGFRELVPRVQRGVIKSLNNLTPDRIKFFKNSFKITDDTLDILGKKPYAEVKRLQQRLNDSFSPIAEKIQRNLSENLKQAGDEFDAVLKASPENQVIDSEPFVNSMRKIFRDSGIMTSNNQFRNINQTLIPRQLRKLIGIYNEVVPGVVGEGGERATGKILLPDYFRYRTILDDAVIGGHKSDRFIFEANNGLVEGAVNSIKGLKNVNAKYSKAKQLFDDFTPESKTGEKVLARFNKLTGKQKNELKRLDSEFPFLDDVQSLNAAQELDGVFEKHLTNSKIESSFSQGTNETKGSARDFLKNMSDVLPEEDMFYPDYRDWISHLDLNDAGAYASHAGIIRTAAEGAESKYLQYGVPAIQKGQKILRRVDKTVGTPIKRAGKIGNTLAPTIIRSTKDQEGD
jgi:hypothetical protein